MSIFEKIMRMVSWTFGLILCAILFGGGIAGYMVNSDGDLFVSKAFAQVPTRTPTPSPTASPMPTPPRFTPVLASPSPTKEPSPTQRPTSAPTPPVWVQDGQVRELEALVLRSQWTDLTVEEQIGLREIVPGADLEGTTVSMTLTDLKQSEDATGGAVQSASDRLAALQDRLDKVRVFHGKQRAAAVALAATLPTPTPEAGP